MGVKSGLVIDGGEVKFRLQAERKATSNLVHIDWLRFTVFRRNAVPTFGSLPDWRPEASMQWEKFLAENFTVGSEAFRELPHKARAVVLKSVIDGFELEHRDPQFRGAANDAFDLAREVAAILGSEFTVNQTIKPGQDYYKWRISIDRNGHECAWVGFLAAPNGKSKASQDSTLHVNVQGHACTFAQLGWAKKMADCIELHRGRITRIDLALDMFDGLGHDFARLVDDYRSGVFDVRGKRPAYDQVGDWANGNSRSIYIGSRTSGKRTNIYEKGDQLHGPEAKSPWVRAELRYGDALRVLDPDMLRNPDSYFAGASDWHDALLSQAGKETIATPVRTTPQLAIQTVSAEVSRNLRWLRDSAAPTFRAALKYMDFDALLSMLNVDADKVPGRISKFNGGELQRAYDGVARVITTAGSAPAAFSFAT